MSQHKAYYHSPIGLIELESDDEALMAVKFINDASEFEQYTTVPAILIAALTQLDEYFKHKRQIFDLPVKLNGTEFQKKVWQRVGYIAYGQTSTYMKIARQMGSAGSVRAVGMANGKNPVLIIVPCHRVISGSNKLTGYSGGLLRKQWLLEHERDNEVFRF